jgi:hypothetical protein
MTRYGHVRALLILGAFIALVVQSEYRRHDAKARATQLRSARDSVRRLSIEASLLIGALGRSLAASGNDGVLVYGHDERTGAATVVPKDADCVVYILSPYCAHCGLNVDSLNALQAGGRMVVGIAIRGSASTMAEWITRHRVRFPVLADASGALPRVVRSESTPLTLTFRRGRLQEFRLGRLAREM